MKKIDISSYLPDDIWPDQLEEQYNICALRALRSAVGTDANGLYSGFFLETAEDWINRSNDLSKNSEKEQQFYELKRWWKFW